MRILITKYREREDEGGRMTQSHEEEKGVFQRLSSMFRLQHAGCTMIVPGETPVSYCSFYEENKPESGLTSG